MCSISSDEPLLPGSGAIQPSDWSHPVDPELSQALLENQLLKDQIASQTQLMHLLTHQLATPLTSLTGSVHLLADPSLGPAHRHEFLTLVQQQVKRLQTLLQDLIALQNLETGVLESHMARFGLRDLIQEVIQTFEPRPITAALSATLPDVWGDRWQISQVLVNLLSNAIKYSPDDSPIQVGAALKQTGWVEIWVQDQGLGIPLADQARLFERFYRVKHRDRQKIQGTGLGLSICKLLVENQGGELGVKSTHGHGSRFCFTLPVAEEGTDGKAG